MRQAVCLGPGISVPSQGPAPAHPAFPQGPTCRPAVSTEMWACQMPVKIPGS